MFKWLKNRKGQPSLEMTVLIAIVAAALLASQVYIKRGLQGKLKDAADQMGSQFSPGHTTYTVTVDRFSSTADTVSSGEIQSSIVTESFNRVGNIHTPESSSEYWGGGG